MTILTILNDNYVVQSRNENSMALFDPYAIDRTVELKFTEESKISLEKELHIDLYEVEHYR